MQKPKIINGSFKANQIIIHSKIIYIYLELVYSICAAESSFKYKLLINDLDKKKGKL